jgi:hypothetical protein
LTTSNITTAVQNIASCNLEAYQIPFVSFFTHYTHGALLRQEA